MGRINKAFERQRSSERKNLRGRRDGFVSDQEERQQDTEDKCVERQHGHNMSPIPAEESRPPPRGALPTPSFVIDD